MANLIYTAILSLDGYIEDDAGHFDWAEPASDAHAFINDMLRQVGTFLYGRRMYETMAMWEIVDTGPDQTPTMRDFAELWRAADKVVYSGTLEAVSSSRTRIEREFDPAAVRRLKASADRDLAIGGPGLAAGAVEAGLVDEWHLFFVPIVLGGGKRGLPAGVRVELELVGERRFGSGMMHLHYRTRA